MEKALLDGPYINDLLIFENAFAPASGTNPGRSHPNATSAKDRIPSRARKRGTGPLAAVRRRSECYVLSVRASNFRFALALLSLVASSVSHKTKPSSVSKCSLSWDLAPEAFGSQSWTSACGRFCCKSRLREAAKRDSVLLTRIAARSIHDGPSEE
jgi:hypothetical protein